MTKEPPTARVEYEANQSSCLVDTFSQTLVSNDAVFSRPTFIEMLPRKADVQPRDQFTVHCLRRDSKSLKQNASMSDIIIIGQYGQCRPFMKTCSADHTCGVTYSTVFTMLPMA